MNQLHNRPAAPAARKLIGVLLVIFFLVVATAVLMPTLRKAKEMAIQESMSSRGYGGPQAVHSPADKGGELYSQERSGNAQLADTPPTPMAQIKSFIATIDLTPSLSVGTAQSESIYEAVFDAKIEARNPDAATSKCEVHLPLPPQLISLSELNVTINGDPSENISIRDGYLVWRGEIDADEAIPMEVEFTAIGKGIYTLEIPPGKIIDVFDATLTAHGSDLRLMDLSLQPETPRYEEGKTIYEWKYKRLMIGRPIAIDILGVAPMDRLGELVWLGPISVLVFGLLVAMVILAYKPEMLDIWMLLMVVGLFAAAYPLMYFAQELMSLTAAIVLACASMVTILSVRSVALLGVKVGTLGVALVAAFVLVVTMVAAVQPEMQGILLTVEAIGALVAMTILLPRTREALAAVPGLETCIPRDVPRPPVVK